MPQKTNKGKTAQRSRRGAHVGATRSEAVGKRRQEKEVPSGPVANSFRELKLVPKSGLQVNAILKGKNSELPEPEKLYNDLLACFRRYYRLTQGKESKIDFVKDLGVSYSQGVYHVSSMFKELVPKLAEVNIDQSQGGECYFTIYQAVAFGSYFHVVEVRFILEELRKMGKAYEELWMDFLNAFKRYIRSPFWFEGGTMFDWALDSWALERVDEMDGEDKDSALAEIQSYAEGEINQFAKALVKRKKCTPKQLLQRISKVKTNWGLFKAMEEACELMEIKFGMDSFEYDYLQGDGAGLRVEFQHCIVWDNEDFIAGEVHMYMEAEANEGVWDPVARMEVDKKCKIRFEDYAPEALQWMIRYEEIQTKLYTISDSLRKKHERANSKSNARLQAQVMCGGI